MLVFSADGLATAYKIAVFIHIASICGFLASFIAVFVKYLEYCDAERRVIESRRSDKPLEAAK
jgi:hypothetical protein